MWQEALADTSTEIDDDIDELIRCLVVSIRYALLTQLLGKLSDPTRDTLSIQRGEPATAEAAGRWDARSFCQANIEVKDRTVTLDDVDMAILKARRSGITELLFATVTFQADDSDVTQRTERESSVWGPMFINFKSKY